MSLPVRFLSKSQPLRLLLLDVSPTEGISRMQSILLGSKSVEESFTALAECKQKSFKSLERDRGRNCEDGSRAPRLYSFSFFFYSLFFSLLLKNARATCTLGFYWEERDGKLEWKKDKRSIYNAIRSYPPNDFLRIPRNKVSHYRRSFPWKTNLLPFDSFPIKGNLVLKII